MIEIKVNNIKQKDAERFYIPLNRIFKTSLQVTIL